MKPHYIAITDPSRIAEIMAGPKYRQYWVMAGAVMWLLNGAEGKIKCQK
jgi:hypothetical protein